MSISIFTIAKYIFKCIISFYTQKINMEVQRCDCYLCEDLRKNLPQLVFKDLETENPVSSAVCAEPDLTSSTSTLVVDDPMSSDNTEDATIPTLVIDETTSPIVNQLFTRRSARMRKPIQKLNL